jgi:poly-gamma-glutamate synthesis protein (capsule biosynthesis protein)
MSKQKVKLIFWTIAPVILGIFVASLVFNSINFGKIFSQKNNSLSAVAGEASVIQLIPPDKETTKLQYFYVNKDPSANGQPKISAKAFLVGDLNTGEVILAKNPEEKFPIASTSKLMTALVTTLITSPSDSNAVAQVSKTALATSGTNGELRLGQKIKVSDLLYPLLLESSNDAAEVLAQYFTRDNFISKMNEVAQSLQMTKTSYEDPSGLSANNQSTVSDMFKLTGYLLKEQPEILSITTKRSYSNKKQSWSNISQFLGDDGYLGGKSGYTDAALQTVVSVFNLPLGQTGYRPIAITLLQSADRRKDVETILKYLKKNIYYGGLADANTNWVEERVKIPDIKDPNFVTLAFTGDIMMDRGVRNSVVKNFNNDYSALFAQSKELSAILKNSDITFANLEGPASDQGTDQKNLYSFRMDPAVIPALKGADLSILSVANNHEADWGLSAYIDTLARLKENEILYTGGGNNKAEAEAPTIIEKYGTKIGFLGFSDVGPDYMQANENTAGILSAKNPRFDEIIKNAAKQVDYLVVTFHFGDEYQAKHNARQEYLAHEAVDDGAKIIIGSHPHVVEDTEVYKNSYIAYSLGNFIFDQSWSQPTMQGMLLQIKLFKDGSMTAEKDATELNSAFQLDKIIRGKEEKVKFQ